MNVFRRFPGGSWHPPKSCLRAVPDQENPREAIEWYHFTMGRINSFNTVVQDRRYGLASYIPPEPQERRISHTNTNLLS